MTNWCENRLEVKGSPEAIAAFRKQCFDSNGLFSLDLAFPPPEPVRGVHNSISDRMGSYGELGVAALMRSDVAILFGSISPILEREAVKAAGIHTYADLECWLGKNNLEALALGAKAVDAYIKTGSCFANDWKVRNWGTRSWMDGRLHEKSDTRLVVSYATAWSTPDKLYHELARMFPDLVIDAKAAEQGLGYAYRFKSENGTITEEELPWSPEFMASMGIEVDEEGNEISRDVSDDMVDVQALGWPVVPQFEIRPSFVMPRRRVKSDSIIAPIILCGLVVIYAPLCIVFGCVMLRQAWYDQETYHLLAQHGVTAIATFSNVTKNGDDHIGDLTWQDPAGAPRHARTLISGRYNDAFDMDLYPWVTNIRIKYLINDAQARPLIIGDERMRDEIVAINYEWGTIFVVVPAALLALMAAAWKYRRRLRSTAL